MESCRYRKCVICGIRNLPKSSTAVLASFPLDPDRCRLWVKASGIEDFVHVPIEKLHQLKYVCGSHFAPECFNAKGNRLLSSAVPTLRLNRPLLSDDLFAEFPLHVKSYYAKFEKGESSKHRQTEILPVETIPKVTKDSDDQALNLSDKKVIATVNKPSGSDDFIPIPSTSKAPMHLTFKRKEAHALSNTMAAVLKMMAASSNSNAEDYNNTAFVVEEMDKLFNWTNGPASPKDVIPRKRENVSEKTNHQESWNYYLKHIDSLQFLKSDSLIRLRNVRCINGFKISLKSLKDICYFLNKEANFKFLNLRQLNQDSLENLFGTIRQHSATNRNPTCSHFNSALKSSIISGLSGPHSRGSNCEIDCNKLFISHREITKSSESVLVPPLQALDSQNCDNQTYDYPVLSLPEEYEIEFVEDYFCNFEEQPTVYVSGYLAGKVLSKFNCDCCQFYLKEDNPDLNNPLYKWISLKEWWQDKVSLTYPKIELCFLVSEAKHVYMTQVLPELHQRHIAQFCTLQLSTHCSMQWFKCNTHCKEVTDYLLSFLSKLFIRKSCKIKNDDFAKSEINEADKIKKAQQQNKDL